MYEELVIERREQFVEGCREAFRILALFLARAVLRSEPDERAVFARLRLSGFAAAAPEVARPHYPIDSLTMLAFAVFLYLAVLSVLVARLPGVPHAPSTPLLMAFKIALLRLATAGATVWLMQRFAFFSRSRGGRARWFGYTLVGLAAAALGSALSLALHLADADIPAGLRSEFVPIGLSFFLCAALAYCCDDWPADLPSPLWLPPAEAAGCGAVMALFTVLAWLGGLPPIPIQGSSAAALWIVLPSLLAMGLGGWVPHIYRTARRAAGARRAEAGTTTRAPAPAAGAA